MKHPTFKTTDTLIGAALAGLVILAAIFGAQHPDPGPSPGAPVASFPERVDAREPIPTDDAEFAGWYVRQEARASRHLVPAYALPDADYRSPKARAHVIKAALALRAKRGEF